MKKMLITTLTVVSAFSIMGVASAAVNITGFMGKGSGFYAGANVGYANADWQAEDLDAASVENKSAMTYGVNVGYMFNHNVGLELAYDMYADTKGKNISGADADVVKNQNFLTISSVFNMTVAPMWNLFAKLGMTNTAAKIDLADESVSDKTNVWAPALGVGATYEVTSNVSVNAQAKYIIKTNATLAGNKTPISPTYTALTVGVNYKF